MQFQVTTTAPAAAFNTTPLTTALPAAFAASQDKITAPEFAYSAVYGQTLADNYGPLLYPERRPVLARPGFRLRRGQARPSSATIGPTPAADARDDDRAVSRRRGASSQS